MIRPRTTLWHFDAGAGAVHHIMNRHRPSFHGSAEPFAFKRCLDPSQSLSTQGLSNRQKSTRSCISPSNSQGDTRTSLTVTMN